MTFNFFLKISKSFISSCDSIVTETGCSGDNDNNAACGFKMEKPKMPKFTENMQFLERILSMLSNPATPKGIQSRFYALVFKDSLLILSEGLALTMTRLGITWILFMEIHASCQTR